MTTTPDHASSLGPRAMTKALSCGWVLALACWPAWAGDFPVNRLEASYIELAVRFADPAMCAKISPQAYRGSPGARPGEQAHFVRSVCYQQLALRLEDRRLCQEVKELRVGAWDGSHVSPRACLKMVQAGELPGDAGYSADEVTAELILRYLGYETGQLFSFNRIGLIVYYSNEMVGGEGIQPGDYRGAYTRLTKPLKRIEVPIEPGTPLALLSADQASFRGKLNTLPDFSQGDTRALEAAFARFPDCRPANAVTSVCGLLREVMSKRPEGPNTIEILDPREQGVLYGAELAAKCDEFRPASKTESQALLLRLVRTQYGLPEPEARHKLQSILSTKEAMTRLAAARASAGSLSPTDLDFLNSWCTVPSTVEAR